MNELSYHHETDADRLYGEGSPQDNRLQRIESVTGKKDPWVDLRAGLVEGG